MERFSYPSIDAAEAESARMLYLLECESWGYKRDEQEKLEMQEQELAQRRMEVNNGE